MVNKAQKSQLIGHCPEARNRAKTGGHNDRLSPKFLPRVRVGQVHFDGWNECRTHSIVQCVGSVRQGPRVDQNSFGGSIRRLTNPIEEIALVIALPAIHDDPLFLRKCFKTPMNVL